MPPGIGYGTNSILYSASEYQPYEEPSSRFINYFGTAALTAGAVVGSTQINTGSGRLIDHIQRASRRVGYSSPGALLNTFRVSEFLSPFTGAIPKNLDRVTKGGKPTNMFQYVFSQETLSNKETTTFLKSEFGKELSQLESKLKINYELMGDKRLVYETLENESVGKLFLEVGGEKHLLTKEAQLFQRAGFESSTGAFGKRLPVTNPAAFAYMQVNGFVDQIDGGIKNIREAAERVFSYKETLDDGTIYQNKSQYLPIKSLRSNANLSYPRSLFAFGMDRFNRLLETATEQLPILNRMSSKFETAFGTSLSVKPGPASSMFLRFGIKAGKIGAVGIGLKELDYWRQETGLLGRVGFGALTSYGMGYGLQKLMPGLDTKLTRKLAIGAFATQMIMPGFDKGVFPGIYTMYKNAQIARSAVGEVTLMNSYRRTMEGILPGISDWKTGAFVGLGLAMASGFSTKPISSRIFEKLNPTQRFNLGLNREASLAMTDIVPKSVRSYQKQAVQSLLTNFNLSQGLGVEANVDFLSKRAKELFQNKSNLIGQLTTAEHKVLLEIEKSDSVVSRAKLDKILFNVAHRLKGAEGVAVMQDELALRFEQGLAIRKSKYMDLDNKLNASFLESLQDIDNKYFGKRDIISRGMRALETTKSSLIHSFFGASKVGEEFTEQAAALGYKTKLGRYGSLFAAGFLAHGLVTGGLLGTMESPGELNDVYSGRKLVEIRRGRWWEGGGSSFEGKNISYYRPHDYVLYMSGATDASRYKVRRSPIHNFILENFTYQLERENYRDRPYPITGGAFENVPIIGGILSATIGRVIKPPKLMHVNEYMRVNKDGDVEFAHRNEYKGPSSKLGGMSPGAPMSPFAASFVLGEMQYQFRELEGLTGYASNVYTKVLTGEETFGIQRPVLESAGKMFSAREEFWKKEIGGGFFTSEPIRRFLPRDRSTIQYYNPILNSMPSWLPDRFKFGDPYRNVAYGEVRLPGAGYAAIRPELKDVNPENYPDIYKYSILADVAPHSREFIMLREKMYTQRSQGMLNERVEKYMDEVDEMLNKKQSYHTTQTALENAYDFGPISDVTRGAASTAKRIVRKGLAPAEYMIPMGFRPSQKLLNDPRYMSMDMIERYEYERLYGTENAFWDKPVRDWFRPALYSTLNLMGYKGVPGYRQKANETNEYFDKLEFMQQMLIAQRAEAEGNMNLKRKALYRASKTAYGVNPQANAMGIYDALPRGEKAFFDLFSQAKGEERARILEMIPEDNKELYINLWKRVDAGDPTLYPGSKINVDEQYMYQQFYNLKDYFSENPMPNTDWVGWHEDVEMDDIKVRYAAREGIDLGDLDMFDQRRRLQSRMGYLNNSEDYIYQQGGISGRGNMLSALRSAGRNSMNSGIFNGQMNYYESNGRSTGKFYYNDDRSGIIGEFLGGLSGF